MFLLQTITISSRLASKKSTSFMFQNNVLRNKCLANPILLNHFWIFDWLLLFYPMGNLIVFVGERFTIALFFLAALGQNVSSEILNQFVGRTVTAKNPFLPSSNSNWNSNNQGHQVIWSSKQSTHTRPPTQFSLTPSVSPRKWKNRCNRICWEKTESDV